MLSPLLRRHRTALALATLLAAASGVVSISLLATINQLAAAGLSQGTLAPIWNGLGWLAALVGLSAGSQILLARLGADVVAALRLDLSLRFLAIDYERLMQRKHLVAGALIQDIGRLGPMALLFPQLAYNIFLILLGCIYLVCVSAPLFGILAAFHGVILILGWTLEQRTRHRFDALRQADDQVFAQFRVLSEGKKELSLSQQRARHFTDALLRPAIAQARALMEQVHRGWGLADSLASALSYAAALGVIALGSLVLQLPTHTIVQVVIAGLFLTGPLHFLVQMAPQVAQSRASLRHLAQVGLDLAAQVEAPAAARSAPDHSDWQLLQARGLSYRYPEEAPGVPRRGVGPLDLDVRRGEMVFITGGNGSGKSTLLLLLCALLRPSEGTLELDGRCVWADPERFRHRFGTVFGDFFLFAHVLDACGQLLPDARIDALLHGFGLRAQVSARQGELSRLNLSTGQRKRLALLQCYAQDRDIVVLDEWAADQDPPFREHFYRTLLPDLQRQGKTLLVITHDDRYFHLADRVLTLEDGRLRMPPAAPAAAASSAPGRSILFTPELDPYDA